MTGKDIILYILENDLTDKEFNSISELEFISSNFIELKKAATMMNIGIESMKVLITHKNWMHISDSNGILYVYKKEVELYIKERSINETY